MSISAIHAPHSTQHRHAAATASYRRIENVVLMSVGWFVAFALAAALLVGLNILLV